MTLTLHEDGSLVIRGTRLIDYCGGTALQPVEVELSPAEVDELRRLLAAERSAPCQPPTVPAACP